MKIVIEIDDSIIPDLEQFNGIIPDLEQFHGVPSTDIAKTIQRIVLREIRKKKVDQNEPY